MLIVANWKIKLNVPQSLMLAQQLAARQRQLPAGTEAVICPSVVSLPGVAAKLQGSAWQLGAQDCFWETRGAFTGGISPADLKEFGCRYVIIGHSEQRQHFGVTDEHVHRKLETALRTGLTPILCIGEDWEQRSTQQKDYVLIHQLQSSLQGVMLGSADRLVVAYEPVWAISTGGTGIEAAPSEVEYASEVIRHIVVDLFGAAVLASRIQIIYGGSVNPRNVASFTTLPAMNGVLVGGASLDADQFFQVIQAAASSK